MPSITLALADHAADRYGIVAASELPSLGISSRRRRTLVEAELLVPVFKGVYRLRSVAETLQARALAVTLASHRTAVTGRAAGRLLGLRRMGRVEIVDVRAPHFAQMLDQPWVRVRRCNVMEVIDVTTRPDGIRTVTPARLAFDLAAVLRPLDLESVIEELVNERHCTTADLLLMDARLNHHARPGSHEFRAVLGSRPDGGAADSHLEVSLHADLRRRGVSGLVRQYRVELPTGWSIHADLAVPHLRWLIQIDHVAWHGGRISSDRRSR